MKLIQGHDVIFLLTDTRESRWLPTIISAAYNKLALTVALGFDDFLITVHSTEGGCYFCPDPLALPGEIRGGEKPLDLQCTVSRPGLSQMAAGIAVETMASTIQENKVHLGEPAMHIRGYLRPHTQISSYRTSCCPTCPACSKEMVEKVREVGLPFLNDCLANLPKVVGELYPVENDLELDTF